MLLDLAIQNESKSDGGRSRQQDGIDKCGDAERPWSAHSLLKILDVGAEGSRNQRARDVNPPYYTMEFRETLPQTIRELQRTKQDGAGASQSVRQQIPAEWMIVLPCWISRWTRKLSLCTRT